MEEGTALGEVTEAEMAEEMEAAANEKNQKNK